MNEIIDVDYRERTLEVIVAEIRTIDTQVRQSVLSGAVEIGRKLEEAKEKVGHGNWEKWCKENLNYSKSQTEKFMRIATEYGDENSPYFRAISNPHMCTDFSISKALRLLSVPEDEVESFVEEVDVSDITVRELEAEIAKLKAEKVVAEKSFQELSEEHSKVSSELSDLEDKLEDLEFDLEQAQSEIAGMDPSAESERIEALKKEIEELTVTVNTTAAEKKALKAEVEAAAAKERESVKAELEAKFAKEREEIKAAAEQATKESLSGDIEAATKAKEEAEEKAEKLARSLDMAGNQDIQLVRILFKQLQETYEEMDASLQSLEPETLSPLADKIYKVMETLLSRVGAYRG